jgi:hypothetical protein
VQDLDAGSVAACVYFTPLIWIINDSRRVGQLYLVNLTSFPHTRKVRSATRKFLPPLIVHVQEGARDSSVSHDSSSD